VSAASFDSPFWDGVRHHRLLIRMCEQCGSRLHPRRVLCPSCGSSGLAWVPSSGRGVVYSVSTLHRAPDVRAEAALPYHLGIVRLEEEVYMFTRFITGSDVAPQIDSAVEVRFQTLEHDRELPVFSPVGK
jgi:uncharacterized OB-fold protein